MSKIKEAVERKFPRYIRVGASVYLEAPKVPRVAQCEHWKEAHRITTQRNELIDKLIEAAELLAKAQGALIA